MREVCDQQLQNLMLLLEFACMRATARMRETTKKEDMSSAGIWMLRHTGDPGACDGSGSISKV